MRTGLLPVRGVHLDKANGRDRPLMCSPVRGGSEIAHRDPFFERVSSPYAGGLWRVDEEKNARSGIL